MLPILIIPIAMLIAAIIGLIHVLTKYDYKKGIDYAGCETIKRYGDSGSGSGASTQPSITLSECKSKCSDNDNCGGFGYVADRAGKPYCALKGDLSKCSPVSWNVDSEDYYFYTKR